MQETIDGWKQLLGDYLIVLERHEEVSKIIPEIIAEITHRKSETEPSASVPSETQIIL
jgi:hypothetical protein